ncbi:MAG: SpoIIE family protein phosphatase [Desulfobacterales bacterium]|nr:SpoIIE family protein phosphatase [Desulfobacterales bacterium]
MTVSESFTREADRPDESPPRVLIADDDPTTRRILERTLEKAGFLPISVASGTEAVENLSDEICAVILDIQMPGMSGLECLNYINRAYPDLSPIMLTASDEVSDAVYAMKHGAFDYIVKPFHAPQITALVTHAVRSFEQTIRLRQTEESLKEARENEIYVASRIQQSLLLGRPPADFPGLEIAHLTIPSQAIDGDFYDFIRLDSESMDLVVADVMGKGIRAAFIGAALKSYFLRVVNEARLSSEGRVNIAPEEIVDSVYSHMIAQLQELESFVTLFYARFYPKQNRLTFVDCGHVRPLHFHHRTRSVSLLKGENMPLGFPEKKPFRQFNVSFEAEDLFLFYSDGLTEASRPDGEMFGEKRLIALLEAHAADTPEGLVQTIRREIRDFSGSSEFADDFTCIPVKIEANAVPLELLGRQAMVFDSRMEELQKVRRFIRIFGKKYMRRASDEPRIAGIELAAVELTTNIIRHAYDSQPGHPVRLEAIAYPREMTLSFYDRGNPFDPDKVPAPVLDGSKEGGMGVYIVEQSVDDITYSRNEYGENCARMLVRWC